MFHFIRRFFTNMFVSILVEDDGYLVYCSVLKNGKVLKTMKKTFDNDDLSKIDLKIIDFLRAQEEQYNAVYVAYFLDSPQQGAIPEINPENFEKFNVDQNNIEFVQMPKNWSIYATNEAIKEAKKYFGNINVDLLYSPFSLIYKNIVNMGFEQKPVFYIYHHKHCVAFAIFEGEKFLYGSFVNISIPVKVPTSNQNEDFFSEGLDDDMEEKSGIEDLLLETSKTDEPDNFFDDVYDIDDIANLDEDDYDGEIEETASQHVLPLHDIEESLESFARDMQVFENIKLSFNEFYKNPIYDSAFVQDIIIFESNTSNFSKAIKKLLETDLLMNVEIIQVDTLVTMNQLAIEEKKS